MIKAEGTPAVKIGVTTDLRKRLKDLQTGSPIPLTLLWKTPGTRGLEAEVHTFLDPYRTHGEWFDFGSVDPVALVAAVVGVHPVIQGAPVEEETPTAVATCKRCGNPFERPRLGRPGMFCGHACRQQAYEERKVQRLVAQGVAEAQPNA